MTKDIENEVECNIEIVFTKKFKEMMDYFSLNYDKEIAGFIIGEIKDGKIRAEELIFPEQKADSGSVDFSGASLVKLRQTEGDKCLKIIGEWHSHNTMGCFWSSTDVKEFIEPFSRTRDISLFIVSSKGDDLVRIEMNKPFKMSIDKVSYYVEYGKELEEECKKIIEDKVTVSSNVSYGRTAWEDWNNWDKDEDEQTVLVESDEDVLETLRGNLEKFCKDKVKAHFTFEDEKTIKIRNISWDIADSLSVAYQNIRNRIEFGDDKNKNECNLYIEFENRGEALSHIKFIKNWLKEAFMEEAEYRAYY